MEERDKIIRKHIFPKNADNYMGSCDFHLTKTEEDHEKYISTSIPITLKTTEEKDLSDPHLILFYYDTQEETLKRWEEVIYDIKTNNFDTITVKDEEGKDIVIEPPRLKSVNLSYEKKLLETFKNITIANPFKWTRIFYEEKKYFVILYNKTIPLEFYDGVFSRDAIKRRYYDDSYKNWYKSFNTPEYTETRKDQKFKSFDHLNLNDHYFRAVMDVKEKRLVKGKYYRIVQKSSDEFIFEEVSSISY